MRYFALLLLLPVASIAQDQTAIEVTPATPVIKDKDLWERTGLLHPFRRMPRFVLHDQADLWTSPIHSFRRDLKWWWIWRRNRIAVRD